MAIVEGTITLFIKLCMDFSREYAFCSCISFSLTPIILSRKKVSRE